MDDDYRDLISNQRTTVIDPQLFGSFYSDNASSSTGRASLYFENFERRYKLNLVKINDVLGVNFLDEKQAKEVAAILQT